MRLVARDVLEIVSRLKNFLYTRLKIYLIYNTFVSQLLWADYSGPITLGRLLWADYSGPVPLWSSLVHQLSVW